MARLSKNRHRNGGNAPDASTDLETILSKMHQGRAAFEAVTVRAEQAAARIDSLADLKTMVKVLELASRDTPSCTTIQQRQPEGNTLGPESGHKSPGPELLVTALVGVGYKLCDHNGLARRGMGTKFALLTATHRRLRS